VSKIGRNEPCPCGSGRKYKKCSCSIQSGETDQQQKAISSLAGYIELLKDYPASSGYVYRGEHSYLDENKNVRRHKERLSSAFHKHKQTSPGSGYFPDFMEPINDFYSEVGHNIADDAKKEFLSFSQHYGLRTNLLDITRNPLVALFFACFGDHDEGSVHIFDNSHFINITKIIQESPMENITDILADGNPAALKELRSIMQTLFKKHSIRVKSGAIAPGEPVPVCRKDIGKPCFIAVGVTYIEHIMFSLFCYTRDKYIENGGSADKVSDITYDELIKSCEDEIVTSGSLVGKGITGHEHFELLLTELSNVSRVVKEMASLTKDNSVYYVSFLHYCLSSDCEPTKDGNRNLDAYMDFLPPMVYKPATLFERARLQRGYFIYQPYMRLEGNPNDILFPFPNVLNKQGLEIPISGAKEIIKELDNLNINQGTLFGDPDNIARYIKGKHGG